MALADRLIHSAVRITSAGDLLGTGFLVTVKSRTETWSHGYVVTAHHVLRNQFEIEVQAADPMADGELHPPRSITDWRQPLPGVDLMIAPWDPFGESTRLVSAASVEDTFLDPAAVPMLGDSIFYVGIFEPLMRPMARSGTIGALEQKGIRHSGGRYEFDAHLVDCRSYSGFSGSPCLVAMPFAVPEGHYSRVEPAEDHHRHSVYYRAYLAGMFTSHYSDEDTKGQGVVSRYGVGVMLPVDYIRKALMTDEARREQAEWDRERRAAKEDAQPPLKDAGLSTDDDDVFTRGDFMGDLKRATRPTEPDDKSRRGKA